MDYNKKYELAVKLIQDGYLIHCTDANFQKFDNKFIKGGMRAKEGYGFYFSDMPYKSIDYGENMKLIRKSDFNFLNSSDKIDTSLFNNDDIETEIIYYENQLDNCRNVREYDYISNVIDNLKKQKEKYDSDLWFYVKQAIKEGAKTYGNLEYLIRQPQYTIPKLIQSYINNGFDGYFTDGIYTVFNVEKLNNLMIKNPEEIINQIIYSNESMTKNNSLIVENLFKEIINEMVSPIVWHFCWLDNLLGILSTNSFKLGKSEVDRDKLPGVTGYSDKRPYYFCTTRSKLSSDGYSDLVTNDNQEGFARIQLDGDKLNSIVHAKASDYFGDRNEPIHGKRAFHKAVENGEKQYYNVLNKENEREDTIWYNKDTISNINKYIQRIDICIPNEQSFNQLQKMIQNIEILANNLQIPLFIYNNITDFDKQNNNVLNSSIKQNEQMFNLSTTYTLNEATEGKIKPTTEWMQQQYDIMNKKLFNGELGDCILRPFTTGKGSNGNTLGWFKITGDNIRVNRKTRQIFQKGYYSNINIDNGNFVHLCKPCIELNANYSAPPESWINTLVHEMCHYYTYMNGFAPVQGHGREFKEIGMIVSHRSGGVITIQRLATAEEMETMELDADIKARNDARAQRKEDNTMVAVVVMKNKTIRMVRTTLSKVLTEIKDVHEKKNDFYYCGYTSNTQLAHFLTEKGYKSSSRTYRFWNIENVPWLPELLRYTWKPLILNHETFRGSLDKIFGNKFAKQPDPVPTQQDNINAVSQTNDIPKEEYHHGFKIVEKNGKYNLVDDKGNPRFREPVDKIWFDKNEDLFYFQHGKWTHKGIPGKWQKV